MVVNCGITTVGILKKNLLLGERQYESYSGFLIEHTIILCVVLLRISLLNFTVE